LNSPGEYEEIEITADADDESEQRADRSVIIGPLPTAGQKWIGVYDEFTDSQDIDLVNESAQLISEATGNYTLGVVGSSNLHLVLFRNGKFIDRWSDDYDHYTEEDIAEMHEEYAAEIREQKATHAGNVERWQELLKPGATTAKLKSIWQEYQLGYDKAQEVAELVELDPEFIVTGHNYLYHIGIEENPGQYIKLAFRSKAAPAFFAKAEGLPQLQMSSWASSVDLMAGQIWEHCSFGIGNAGGGGKGVQVLVWGSAIDQKLLEPSRLRLIPPMILSATPSYSAPPEDYDFGSYQTPDDKTVWYVNTPDFEIPAGSQNSLNDAYQSGVSFGRALAANFLGQFSVVLSGKSVLPGEGDLYIGVAPFENYEEGRISHAIPVRVKGSKVKGWTPLPFARLPEIFRAQAAMTHLLQMLEPTTQCWALVALPADRSGYQKLFVEIIEEWHNFLAEKADGNQYAVTTMGSNPFDSKMVQLPFKEIPAGAKWQNFRETLVSVSRFMAMSDGKKSVSDRYSPPHISSSGFAFGTPLTALGSSAARADLPGFLTLWADTLGWESTDTAAAESKLTELVQRLMSESDGYQAFVTRQGGYPQNPDQPTPYEYLASVNTDWLENAAWCKSFVRGVCENMWLGRDMLSRLRAADSDAEQKLARIAEVQPSGEGLFIRLWDSSQIAELENLLLPVTPVMENVGEFMIRSK
jgi:hypothetical protein